MANKPFFSIIIPSLNEEKFLPRLLNNLQTQVSTDFEVIHVDGQSDDHTAVLAKNFASSLPTFKQIISPLRHVSHQRNLGAKAARGRYLLFIDADTQLPADFLKDLAKQLREDPTDLFTTWSVPDSNKTGDRTIITIINLSLELSQILETPFAIGVFVGCTPKAFTKIDGFREDLQFGEDEEFVKTGYKKGLSFTVYRQPRFIYSLRRFRNEGTLPTIQQLAAKRLKAITNGKPPFKTKVYQMGGHVHIFHKDSTDQSILQRLDRAITLFPRRPNLKKFLNELITFEKLDS